MRASSLNHDGHSTAVPMCSSIGASVACATFDARDHAVVSISDGDARRLRRASQFLDFSVSRSATKTINEMKLTRTHPHHIWQFIRHECCQTFAKSSHPPITFGSSYVTNAVKPSPQICNGDRNVLLLFSSRPSCEKPSPNLSFSISRFPVSQPSRA